MMHLGLWTPLPLRVGAGPAASALCSFSVPAAHDKTRFDFVLFGCDMQHLEAAKQAQMREDGLGFVDFTIPQALPFQSNQTEPNRAFAPACAGLVVSSHSARAAKPRPPCTMGMCATVTTKCKTRMCVTEELTASALQWCLVRARPSPAPRSGGH